MATKTSGARAGSDDDDTDDSFSARFSKGASSLLDSELAASVKAQAQQIWLAGMGAFAKAQAEGGKVFETLVKEGLGLQQKTQGMAEERFGEAGARMSAMAETVSAKAGQNWDKLEALFEQRTAKALQKLGMPTAQEVAALSARVDALSAQVARLSSRTAAARQPAAAKKAARKTAPKPAGATPAKRSRKPGSA